MEEILKYTEELILSLGGNKYDVEQITKEVKESGTPLKKKLRHI